MSSNQPSLFRTALQISSERIGYLKDTELSQLMSELLRAQAHRSGSPLSQVAVNTEEKATDGGCDGWTAKPARPDEWLGNADTCWQFKAGKSGTPARLKQEIGKPMPSSTLAAGGRFVVIASGATNGESGRKNRHSSLMAAARALGLPTERIFVLCSEHLATWCNQHPAVAARWSGRPPGLLTLSQWEMDETHQSQWYAPDELKLEILHLQSALDYTQGNLRHIHIQGQPGVGKTRLALELCRNASWSNSVIYFEQSTELGIIQLIDDAATDENVRLTVVADEVEPGQVVRLRNAIARADGRIRLITIGHCPTPDPERIPGIAVRPIEQQMLCNIVKAWYPSMPIQHVQFVARFADGYVRLAKLAADAVGRGNVRDTNGLFGRHEIQLFLDRMLGTEHRRSLHVVAVLENVGWSGSFADEGKSIAVHFGLDWNQVRVDVHAFHKRLGIAPCSGNYRYISPSPLGIYLALDAWDTFPELMDKLRDSLPTEEAKNAYDRRLRSTFGNAYAREYAKSRLQLIVSQGRLFTVSALHIWSSLSPAYPEIASKIALEFLEKVSIEERLQIFGEARRVLVTTLAGLARYLGAFHYAVRALALLAEAENEQWANNATGEFLARFQIWQGGTSAPYTERLTVIDEMSSSSRINLIRLAVKALVMASGQHAVPSHRIVPAHEVPSEDWRPSTPTEHDDCVIAALTRLRAIAELKFADLEGDLVKATTDVSMLLRNRNVRREVSSLFEVTRSMYPESREAIRRTISKIIHAERNHWRELREDDLSALEVLHAQYEEDSLAARLKQLVGPPPWDEEGAQDFVPLALDFIKSAGSRPEIWEWLMSGDAGSGYRFGEVLAGLDVNCALLQEVQRIQYREGDLRALCGYIAAMRHREGNDWYDAWFREQSNLRPRPIRMLFELAWRISATPVVAKCIQEIVSFESLDPVLVRVLTYSNWKEDLDGATLSGVLRTLMETGHEATALEIIGQRIDIFDEESIWEETAMELITAPCLIRSGHTTGYYWNKVALRYVGRRAQSIAAAILREHGNRSMPCFSGGNKTEDVLIKCAERDPKAVWELLRPYLSCVDSGHSFTYGFPNGVLDRLTHSEILTWVDEDPCVRPAMIARLLNLDFSRDDSLSSQILESHAQRGEVSAAFFSELVSSESRGPLSEHWEELAGSILTSAARTMLPQLKRWAQGAANSLREMAERERDREREFELGRGR